VFSHSNFIDPNSRFFRQFGAPRKTDHFKNEMNKGLRSQIAMCFCLTLKALPQHPVLCRLTN
jgi:hypothetical protein